MTVPTSMQIENAIRLAAAQSAAGNSDTEIDLKIRLYGSRAAVHCQQEQIELVDTNSMQLVARFSKY